MSAPVIKFPGVFGDERDDSELLEACADGDGSALAEVFDRHQAVVQRFIARAFDLGAADLEDIVQATFVEVYRNTHRFQGDSAVRTWILGIAYNVARHHVRSGSRRRRLRQAYAQHDPPQNQSSRPDAVAASREQLKRLQRAMKTLSEGERVVFVLCAVEGQRGREVAKALELKEGTVYRRLHEARRKLAQALEDK